MVTKTEIILDDSQCRAILNEAGEKFCQAGTTGNFLNTLIKMAFEKGFQAGCHLELTAKPTAEPYSIAVKFHRE